jgi:mRNA interferase RelE/StbE
VSVTWHIRVSSTAKAQLAAISDARVRRAIAKRIDELKQAPDQRGKPLTGPLADYYSVRAVGQRYRIIYQLDRDTIIVYIVALGIRKEDDKNDIYTLAQRLFTQGLLVPPAANKE